MWLRAIWRILIPATTDVQPAASPAPAPSGQGRAGTLFRALKHRNFQLFFSGQIISLVGTWMQTVAQAWLVYRLTGSSALLGVLGFVSQIPIFLLVAAWPDLRRTAGRGIAW